MTSETESCTRALGKKVVLMETSVSLCPLGPAEVDGWSASTAEAGPWTEVPGVMVPSSDSEPVNMEWSL